MDFAQRIYDPELLDGNDIPAADIRRNMAELNTINRWLGGHAVTRAGFRALAGKDAVVSVAEIGCGGGDNLQAIQQAVKGKMVVRCMGIDHNADCLAVARERLWETTPHLVCSDYRSVRFPEPPDVIFTSLFCHHLGDGDLVELLRRMKAGARKGFFINDLHRHRLAYFSIRWLTQVFSRSYLVRNDAPLSVRRGFSRTDWTRFLHQAGIAVYSIRWCWAFRWLIIVPA